MFVVVVAVVVVAAIVIITLHIYYYCVLPENKILKEGMKLHWNFQGGGGSNQKTYHGRVWIFCGTTH